MGSSSSRIRSSSSGSRSRSRSRSRSGSRPKRSKLKFSSFFCGGASTSQLDHELEDYPQPLVGDFSRNSIAESSSTFSSEVGHATQPETGSSSESTSGLSHDAFVEYNLINAEVNINNTCISNEKHSICDQARDSLAAAVSTESLTHLNTEDSHTVPEECRSSCSHGDSIENHGDVHIESSSDSRSISVTSDSIPRHQFLEGDTSEEATTSGSGFLLLDSELGVNSSQDVLHVDVMAN
uniref:Ring finger protein n=1 Tax=Solanum tuberosum TaxID=4113 RepID=M0ZN94_SOLTU